MPRTICFIPEDTGARIYLFRHQALLFMPVITEYEDIIREIDDDDDDDDSNIILPFPQRIIHVAVLISLYQWQRQDESEEINKNNEIWIGDSFLTYKDDKKAIESLCTLNDVAKLFKLSLFTHCEYLQRLTSAYFRKQFASLSIKELKKECNIDNNDEINVSKTYLYAIKLFKEKVFSPEISKKYWFQDHKKTVFQNESHIDVEGIHCIYCINQCESKIIEEICK